MPSLINLSSTVDVLLYKTVYMLTNNEIMAVASLVVLLWGVIKTIEIKNDKDN